MAKATLKDLWDRAQSAIDRNEQMIYDVAGESCQIVDNVKHMYWFRKAVAQELIDSTRKYSHLSLETKEEREARARRETIDASRLG